MKLGLHLVSIVTRAVFILGRDIGESNVINGVGDEVPFNLDIAIEVDVGRDSLGVSILLEDPVDESFAPRALRGVGQVGVSGCDHQVSAGGDVVGYSQRLGESLLTRDGDRLGVAGDGDLGPIRSSVCDIGISIDNNISCKGENVDSFDCASDLNILKNFELIFNLEVSRGNGIIFVQFVASVV